MVHQMNRGLLGNVVLFSFIVYSMLAAIKSISLNLFHLSLRMPCRNSGRFSTTLNPLQRPSNRDVVSLQKSVLNIAVILKRSQCHEL